MGSSRRNLEDQKPIYRRHAFALGVIATLISVMIFGVALQSGATDAGALSGLELAPSIGSLLVAVVSLFMSLSALEEQRKARQASTDPVIVVHFGSREDAPSMITLEVSNVGAGAAQNVSVGVDPTAVADLLSRESVITDFRETVHPIRVIPQDRSVSYNFGVGFKVVAEPLQPPIRVEVTYQDIDGKPYQSTQWLDVRELRWQRADMPPAARTAIGIEKLAKELGKLANDRRRQHVIVQDIRAFREEEKALYEEMRERSKGPSSESKGA